MVSAIDSTRLLSAQYALTNLRGSDDGQSSDTSSSSAASILSGYGLDPDSASLLSNKALASLLDSMPVQDDDTETETGAQNPDVTSASFRWAEGEYVPIPPVLGPVSASPARL